MNIKKKKERYKKSLTEMNTKIQFLVISLEELINDLKYVETLSLRIACIFSSLKNTLIKKSQFSS